LEKTGVTRTTSSGSVTSYRGDAGPHVADWDGDGVDDLVVGYSDGSVAFCKATFDETKRRVLAPAILLLSSCENEAGQFKGTLRSDQETGELVPIVERASIRAKPALADWNEDGQIDLLVGDFFYAFGPQPDLTTEQREECGRLQDRSALMDGRHRVIHSRILDEVRKAVSMSRHWRIDDPDFDSEVKATTSQRLREDKDYQAATEEKASIQLKLRSLEAPYISGGFVWVYLRKPASAAAGK
jgi:hypothetical protein